MGQRLNIEIHKKGEEQALVNCYYHWSAYTASALKLTINILENLYEFKDEKNERLRAIQLLQTTGGGLQEDEYGKLEDNEKQYCHISQDRNLGLICFTDKGMEETRNWEEGRVEIYLDYNSDNMEELLHPSTRVYFGVLWGDTKESINEVYEEEVDFDNLIEFDFDLDNMSLDDLRELYSRIDEIENDYNGHFKIKGDNMIYNSIY